jgi:hypothetical protein
VSRNTASAPVPGGGTRGGSVSHIQVVIWEIVPSHPV